jgi:two-component system, NarL family, sensor kinase
LQSGAELTPNWTGTKDAERMPIEIETALFRVLQESLTNIHRYSGSSEVHILFQRQTETAILKESDCGCGIPAELLNRLELGCVGTGVGLSGMRERIQELNGKLEINSDGFGTSLRTIVPLFVKDQPNACRDYEPFVLSEVAHLSATEAAQ